MQDEWNSFNLRAQTCKTPVNFVLLEFQKYNFG